MELAPLDPYAHTNLANVYLKQGKLKEAESECREALRLRKDHRFGLTALCDVLRGQGRLKDAEAVAREAIFYRPNLPPAHFSLGVVLRRQGKFKEAEEAFNEALRLRPNYAEAYTSHGNLLRMQNKLKEAEDAQRKAIEFKPQMPEGHWNLGEVLFLQKRYEEAAAAALEGDRLRPTNPLGRSLIHQIMAADADSVEKALRSTIQLHPESLQARLRFAELLVDQKRHNEAETHIGKAIAIKKDDADAHYLLGLNLSRQGKSKDAAPAYREATRLKADFAEAHCNLGLALRDQGEFAEALKSLHCGHDLGTKKTGWPYPSDKWINQCEHLLSLDKELTAILNGETKGVSAEKQAVLASFAQRYKGLHVEAVRLYAAAFRAEPGLADNESPWFRYDAACSAALAVAGKAKDGSNLTDSERAEFRAKALAWLLADLEARTKPLTSSLIAAIDVQETMKHWQTDADLASVRDDKKLAGLTQEEQAAWRKLWADVEELRKIARSRYTETILKGRLTQDASKQTHEVKLVAGKRYLIDMTSGQFNTYLKLQDEQGDVLAENDDTSRTNRNSRVEFTPKENGTYRIIATSLQQRGRGAYEVFVREFAEDPKPERER